MHVVPALGITGLSNDRASVCDEFINPQYATVTQTAGYEAYNCTGPDRRDDWINQFARATGLQTSWVLGYRFGADASPAHLSLALPCGLVGDFRAIVLVPVRPVSDGRHDRSVRRPVAAQLVGDWLMISGGNRYPW